MKKNVDMTKCMDDCKQSVFPNVQCWFLLTLVKLFHDLGMFLSHWPSRQINFIPGLFCSSDMRRKKETEAVFITTSGNSLHTVTHLH